MSLEGREDGEKGSGGSVGKPCGSAVTLILCFPLKFVFFCKTLTHL